MRPRSLIVAVLVLLAAAPSARAAWLAHAGWNRADLSLHDEQDGFQVGVGELRPLGDGPFDLAWTVDWQRRRGSQPMIFDSTRTGPTYGTADVTLDHLQTGLFLGVRPLPDATVRPRLYAGASVAIEIAEDWDTPDGSTNRVYAYEDLDLALHLGASMAWGRWLADVRWSAGLLEQVLDLDYDNAGGWNKASEALPGVGLPQAGDRITTVQVGLGVLF